jgi:two-component system sensor histidine kinase AtoS
VEKSLEKLRQYQVSKMMDIDYSAIITVTEHGKIQIDGSQNHNTSYNISDAFMIDLITTHQDRIRNIVDGVVIKESCEEDNYDMLFVPIRRYDNYYVFTFMCKKNGDLSEREIRITEFLTTAIYENVMLDYEIIKERNYLQSIFDSTTSFILTFDLSETIIATNKKVAQISGVQFDLTGINLCSILKENQYRKAKKLYNEVITYIKPITGEEEFLLNDGKRLFIHYTLSPMLDKDNDVIGVVALGLDVTRQKIYEKEIEQLRQYALLGEISAEVAHDIKNPLMSIRGCARLLQKKVTDEHNMGYIIPIVEEVDRINKIIEQMLSYSRLSMDNGLKYIDINATLDKCIDAVSFHKQFKYIDIVREYTDDLPHIEGSDVRMQQALMNLLLNAIQSITNEGVICIKTKNIHDKKQIMIEILDNGKGIDEKEKDKIFEPFYTTKPDGTGLGLSIVHKVIDEVGGFLGIESTVNQGTAVRLNIPYTGNGRWDK